MGGGRAPAARAAVGDAVLLRRWFAAYGLFLLVVGGAFAAVVAGEASAWSAWRDDAGGAFAALRPAAKLLGLCAYVSVCCTFFPLPTGWIIAGVATREAAVAAGLPGGPVVIAAATALAVGAVGAAGSTMANLNDYHLFTWMLRSRRIAGVRHTRTYRAAARWFGRSPFFILVVFNVLPIPVDVIRMLATTYRYPRLPFAAANFVGRFIRYGVIAFATYWWDLGWIAVVGLLAVAVVLGTARAAAGLLRRTSAGRAVG